MLCYWKWYKSRKTDELCLRFKSHEGDVLVFLPGQGEILRTEEILKREKMLKLLEKGLKQLPAKQEKALRMTILESDGLSLRNVGIRNNIPYSTLRHRNREGLRRMRRFLEQAVPNEKASLF